MLDDKKPNAKLTVQEVYAIKEARKQKVAARDLALYYKVSVETIRRIDRGDTWTQETHAQTKSQAPFDPVASAQRANEMAKELSDLKIPKREPHTSDIDCPYPMSQWTAIEKGLWQFTKRTPDKAFEWENFYRTQEGLDPL